MATNSSHPSTSSAQLNLASKPHKVPLKDKSERGKEGKEGKEGRKTEDPVRRLGMEDAGGGGSEMET